MRPPVAVLVLVVLAGCSGITGPSGETATVTPAPVQTPAPPTPESNILPPGVNGDGVVDVARLVRAHQTVLTNQSYTWNARKHTSGRRGNPTGTDIEYVAHVANESTYRYWTNHRIVWRNGRPRYLGNYSEFATSSARYVYFEDTENNTQYDRTSPAPARVRVGRMTLSAIERYLPATNSTVAVTRVDGQPYYEIHGTGIDTPVAPGGVTNYTVEALVRPDGLVYSISVRYRIAAADRSRRVEYEYAYSQIGTTTVDRPAWVDQQWDRHSTTAEPARD